MTSAARAQAARPPISDPSRETATRTAMTPVEQVQSEVHATLDLEGSTVVLVTMLANQLSASGSLTFQSRHGLSAPEWKVMAVVAAMESCSGAEIAQVLSIDKAAVSRTVRTLVERDLLETGRKTRNGNAITLTSAGQSLHDEALATAHEREKVLLEDLAQDERVQLHDWLRLMIRRMPILFNLADQPLSPEAGTPAAGATVAIEPSMADQQRALRDRVVRLESLLADVMLENAALRREGK